MTLSLGGSNNSGTSGNVTSNTEKLINLDPIVPTSSATPTKHGGSSQIPPPPPPRISSDPNNPMNLTKKLSNGDNSHSVSETLPVTVTHFSPSVNGFGLEKETIFTDENGQEHKDHNATTKTKNTNPFLTNSPGSTSENDTAAIYRSQSRKENNNYENVRMFTENGTVGNPFTPAKFNTIGRSNPFSSVKGNSSNRNNPFLDVNGGACDSDNPISIQTDSPDASIDPTPILQPAVLKQIQHQKTSNNLTNSNVNGGSYSGTKINKTVSTTEAVSEYMMCTTPG